MLLCCGFVYREDKIVEYSQYRELEISEIGVGCYGLGGAYGPVDEDGYKEVLRKAYESGVNLFDTAEAYGEGAERILGDVLEPFRGEVYISTKVGGKKDIESPLSYKHVKQACHKSLERLQTDYIDVYFIHFDDPDTPVSETLRALDDLRSEGKIRHYGVSHLPIQRIREYLEKGDVSFCLMELSPVARKSTEELLPLCRKYGVKGMAFSITGRGILTGKIRKNEGFKEGDIRKLDPQFKKARFDSAMKITERLQDLGDKYNKTSTQVAINWVLSQEGIISGLTGASSKEHLDENLGGSGWRMKKEDLEELEIFLESEDKKLAKKEPELIKEILTGELPAEDLKALHDLIYAIEASIDQGMAEEKELTPVARELLEFRKSEGDIEKNRLEQSRNKLKEIIL